jgi:hypothetical protein
MLTPEWGSVDDTTADLLALVERGRLSDDDGSWARYVEALATVARDNGGVIRPNALRPLVRGVIAPKRIGAHARRALLEGLVRPNGEYEESDDVDSRNAGKPVRCWVWCGGPT